MVDPDEVCAAESERIATPNVFVVQVAHLDVLDDDVLASELQALALYYTFVADAYNRLVGADLDGRFGRLVVGHCFLGRLAVARVL